MIFKMLGLLCMLILLGGDVLIITSVEATCSPSPCGENANCSIINRKTKCTCKTGHSGDPLTHCFANTGSDLIISDACNPTPCGIDSICTGGGSRPKCSCPPGYAGDPSIRCVSGTNSPVAAGAHSFIQNDPCNPTPCGLNAICIKRGKHPRCSCSKGYHGDPLTKCTQQTSANLGTAASTGPNSIKAGVCKPSPCGTNALCHTERQRPVCKCPKGYDGNPIDSCTPSLGSRPESHIRDACSPFPCGENAKCTATERRVRCTCLSGYEGDARRGCYKKATHVSVCGHAEFECEGLNFYNNTQCIFLAEVCDGVKHCDDGSDEDEYLCPEFYLECGVQSRRGQCATLGTNCPSHTTRDESGPFIKDRITGGVEAPIEAWPWMVAVGYKDKGVVVIQCGGTLISSKYVLSAAHCFDANRRNGIVRVGEHHLDKKKDCYYALHEYFGSCTPDGVMQEVGIIGVHRHPKYKQTCNSNCNDIAVVKLEDKVRMDGRHVNKICLPSNLKIDIGFTFQELSNKNNNVTGMVAGWGNIADGIRRNKGSPVLMQASLQTGDDDKCKNIIESPRAYPEKNSVFCAGDCSSGVCKDTCRGDSGGPLMISDPSKKKWFLVGVTHAGPSPCGQKNIRARYMNVIHYIDWIKNKISQP